MGNINTHCRQDISPDTTQHIQLVYGLMIAPSACKVPTSSSAWDAQKQRTTQAKTFASRTPVHAHRFELSLLHRRGGLRAHTNLDADARAVKGCCNHLLKTTGQRPAYACAIERCLGQQTPLVSFNSPPGPCRIYPRLGCARRLAEAAALTVE